MEQVKYFFDFDDGNIYFGYPQTMPSTDLEFGLNFPMRMTYLAHSIYHYEGNKKVYFKSRNGIKHEKVDPKEETFDALRAFPLDVAQRLLMWAQKRR
jgi:hypothetical protein